LNRLGFPSVPIRVGENREPLFPPGVSGSITHSGNCCSAAVVRIGAVRAIGIDVEANTALDYAVARQILNQGELLHARSHSRHGNCCAEVLMFSLKEAFFKAAFPICKRYIDFSEVEIQLSQMRGLCDIHILNPDLATGLNRYCINAKYWFDSDYVYSAVTLLEGKREFNPTYGPLISTELKF
jgi:4'-phosphopantetheinyl transferase EntD